MIFNFIYGYQKLILRVFRYFIEEKCLKEVMYISCRVFAMYMCNIYIYKSYLPNGFILMIWRPANGLDIP